MEYSAKEKDLNKRLDLYISSLGLGISRSQAQKLISEKYILVNKNEVKSSYKIRAGDSVCVELKTPEKISFEPQNIPLDIIYEDSDIIVVNKSRGMVMHPAVGNYSHTLVNALLYHIKDLSGIGGALRPGIVHRLDKDTSGVIVAAKNDKAHESLSRQFKNHTVNKVYLAIVRGNVKKDRGIIDEPIGRHPVNRKKMAVVRRGRMREAYTEYEVVKRFKGFTLLKIKLKTGRTHQIRVHLSHIGHPVVGDPVYGKGIGPDGIGVNSGISVGKGQLLHSHILGFIHPATQKYVEFRAEMPDDMKHLISCG